jgi:isoleucyl-tRNA synthetase
MASTADHPNAYPRAGATEVATHPDFPALERQVLAHWAADGTFQASIDRRAAGDNGSNEYVFYDGPPFANGLPHYGHLLTGYVKDVVPRYHTMRGRKVERRFGWDTHGLPAEVEAERQLGIKHKSEIVGMGVQRRLPPVGAAVHPRVAGVRHPAGPLGRLRERLQDP